MGNIEILSVSDRIQHPQGNAVHDVDMMLMFVLIFIVRAEDLHQMSVQKSETVL